MLPFADTNNISIDIPTSDDTYIIGVLGYSKSCGKTLLAASLAMNVTGDSTVILTGDDGHSGAIFQEFLAESLHNAPSIHVIADVSQITSYDVVILDDWGTLDVVPDLVIYIVPDNKYSDNALDLIDSRYEKYIAKLGEALDRKYPGTPIKLIEERVMQKSKAFQLLDETDRLVVRELERSLLAGSSLNEFRELLRNSNIETWRRGIKL